MASKAPKDIDEDVKGRDLLDLANADALTAFFARLGYDTNARTEQTAANLGIGDKDFLAALKSVTLIAEHRLGAQTALQVYVFELKSVTLAHTRALARVFRNRKGNFLLVLTTGDFERLDFVLLERALPTQEARSGNIAQAQAQMRPRTLTVTRRDPGRVALRVLRRFTYTESDPYAQWDKLRSAYDILDWSEPEFNNRALFSDYFLKNRFAGEDGFPEWKEAAETRPKAVMDRLRDLYRGASANLGKPESEVRKTLLEPTLDLLGFKATAGKAAGEVTLPPTPVRGL